jgi:hypothetical protein
MRSDVISVLVKTLLLASLCSATAEELPFFNKVPLTVEMHLAEHAVQSLRTHPRRSVSADVIVSGKTWREVPLRLKGSGTFQSIDEKPSLTVEFPNGQIHLNNSADDPSALNEFIGAYLATRAEIPVTRVNHCVLTLNSRRLGLYVVKEGSAGEADLLDANPTWDDLKKNVDLQDFSAFVAFEVIVCHWDGYALRRNNFNASRDKKNGRLKFQPAGMDQLFAKPDYPWQPNMTGPYARLLMQSAQGRALYEEQFRRIFKNVCHSNEIKGQVDERTKQLKPLLTASEFSHFQAERDDLLGRIQARETFLRRQLTINQATNDNPR